MEQPFNAVNGDFHDKLEALALEKKQCEVIYFNTGGRVVTWGRVESLYQSGEMEFLQMQSGLEIRLDNLIQVDGLLALPVC
ncbi:MAG: hypothetical protein ABIN89_07355 [Chitinophagaceae bacterium]